MEALGRMVRSGGKVRSRSRRCTIRRSPELSAIVAVQAVEQSRDPGGGGGGAKGGDQGERGPAKRSDSGPGPA